MLSWLYGLGCRILQGQKRQRAVDGVLERSFAQTRAKVVKLIDLLSEQGVLLKGPYTRQIRGKIRELRVKDHLGHIRVLYFTFTGRRFVLLHGFLKKTDKTPEREIELAERRMTDFLERYGGKS